MDFSGYQNEIYLGGLAGQKPELPISYADLEARAKEVLTPEAYGYVAGGAGSEDTMRQNLEAFRRWRIVPRMLRDVSARDLSTEVLGTALPAPILLAPVGVLGIVHEDGELAVARAAASLGVPFILSTAASNNMEDVAEAAGDGTRWFQLYWPNDEEIAASFVARAEKAGYSALVVTLDVPQLAWRPRDLQGAFLPFLKGEGIANYLGDPAFRAQLDEPPEDNPTGAVLRWVGVFPHPTLTWDRLAWLRDRTSLPILLKGVLHPDDARKAADAGMNGVIVSNHGGRQVDGAIATLDALPAVVEAAGDLPVLLDSGVRTGADAVKGIALGAGAVLLGRPYVWGLGVGGEDGVRHVLRSFLAELELTMALSGLTRISEIERSILAPSPSGDGPGP
jgi:isopentenyl diphosphate isomerase/L-lactate dehydrogenase-like FMN-dependent dehydrogenase